ncbi:MAG: response regulator [Alphaproteobacteria bacterium]|nr:response regulator [Alphaproteobacteria bacterium]
MAKILAAEDEPLVRILIVEALTEAGHTVVEACDGEVALAIVKSTPDLDIVVSDVRMPKMDGFSLATAARAVRPLLKMFFITGYPGTTLPANLTDAKVMQKPFDPNELVARIEAIVRKDLP